MEPYDRIDHVEYSDRHQKCWLCWESGWTTECHVSNGSFVCQYRPSLFDDVRIDASTFVFQVCFQEFCLCSLRIPYMDFNPYIAGSKWWTGSDGSIWRFCVYKSSGWGFWNINSYQCMSKHAP